MGWMLLGGLKGRKNFGMGTSLANSMKLLKGRNKTEISGYRDKNVVYLSYLGYIRLRGGFLKFLRNIFSSKNIKLVKKRKRLQKHVPSMIPMRLSMLAICGDQSECISINIITFCAYSSPSCCNIQYFKMLRTLCFC